MSNFTGSIMYIPWRKQHYQQSGHCPRTKRSPLRWLYPYLLVLSWIGALIPALFPAPVFALDSCYAVADENDYLVALDKTNGNTVEIGPNHAADIEAIAFGGDSETLYAANGGTFGTLDLATGHFTPIGEIGTGSGSVGTVRLNDVDGLSWDATIGVMYGTQRREERTNEADLLFPIDPVTGALIPGTFNGADYVAVATSLAGETDVDDIAFDPLSGLLYGIVNSGGVGGTLVIIDKQSGALLEIGSLRDTTTPGNVIDDMEGLAFFNDGQLYGSTGSSEPKTAESNRLYKIDKLTGQTTLVGAFPAGFDDFEGLDCLTAKIADDDNDGLVNASEDLNSDGILTNDDTDGDGLANYLDADDDGDHIATRSEDPNGNGNPRDDDIDRDGIPNYLDTDDDNDGVLTRQEDTNQDGAPANDDLDGDGIPNYLESGDTDGDGVPNEQDPDDDSDTVLTLHEDRNRDGIPWNDDTDGDKRPNFLDRDDDGDTLLTNAEDTNQDGDPRNDDRDNDRQPNFLDDDDDNDGILTADEDLNGDGDLANDDMDGDGIPDWLDVGRWQIYLPTIKK